jgi:hypothetical protein
MTPLTTRVGRGCFVGLALLGLGFADRSWAQSATELPASSSSPVVGTVSNMTRVESWSFFTPPPAGGNPDYTFVGDRAYLGLRVRQPRFDLQGGFVYVRLENLPRDAIGPGGMGTGAFYFAASGVPYSYQVFLSELLLSAHGADRTWWLEVGRMTHESGAEGDRERQSPLGALRRLRLDGRLVGTFDWSYYQRRFDGVRVAIDRDPWYGGGSVLMPTQGGFEESANLTMTTLQVMSGVLGRRHRAAGAGERWGESQVFAHGYRDRRRVAARPDNTGVPASAVDVSIATIGASHYAVTSRSDADVDWLGWGAVQTGDWYGQTHRAYSLALEGGVRWPRASGKPWVRTGFDYASGDGNGGDERHGTFLPMLPDTRTYALSMVYAPLNLRDVFVQVLAEPHPRVRLRADLHRLDLAQAADRWYQGSGATERNGRFFGFATRPSSRERSLGTMIEGTMDADLTRYWSISGYAGYMWGGRVVRSLFTGDRLFFWYVENVLRLTLRPT